MTPLCFRRRFFPLLLAGLLAAPAGAQTLESLQEEVRKAQEEIAATDKLLSKTKKEQQTTQSDLKLIRNKIRNRQKIVTTLERQSQVITGDIGSKSDTIAALENELSGLREAYGEMVRDAYKNYKLNNFMVFLFASKDFNDATRRIAYMRRYNRMRERKAAEIDSIARSLGVQVVQLQEKKESLDEVRKERTGEIDALGRDEKQYKTSADKLHAQAGKLSEQIRGKQMQMNRLQQQIQRIVSEEARKNRSESRTAAQEEYLAGLTGRFDQNRGKLPYPVRGGVIVDRYGVHEHATQKGLMVNNKGVNMAGEPGAEVHCVFEGDVSAVIFVQGLGNSVIIRHGNYLTAYANLGNVTVKKGDKVTLGQTIGQLSTSADEDSHTLHFEIWEETNNLNPEPWLHR